MNEYKGPIRNDRDARRMTTILERAPAGHPRIREARGAVSLLRLNWEAIAARPHLAERVAALAAIFTETPLKG